MSYAKDGFLTESPHHVQQLVRITYAEWRNLLGRINQLAVANQHSIMINRGNQVERYAAVLFARTLSTTQASILLLESGLVPQARALLRSALETYLALAAIAKEPAFVNKLIEGHAAEQKRVTKNMELWQSRGLREIAGEAIASGRWLIDDKSSAKSLSTLAVAQKAGLEDLYRTMYMSLSWPVHGASVDLQRHVIVVDGEEAGFQNEPEVEGQESSWLCAIDILLRTMTALALIFPSDVDQGPLNQYHADTKALVVQSKKFLAYINWEKLKPKAE